MPLQYFSFELGPLQNNTFILLETQSKEIVVIDPSFESQAVIDEIHRHGYKIRMIWLTHAHFDHSAGVGLIASAFEPKVLIGLHPADLDLYHQSGGAEHFGLHLDPGPEPLIKFYNGQKLHVGDQVIEVRHTPGHTRGHVAFYSDSARILFCGDLIFAGSVGRTDLPGGDHLTLLRSIQTQVLTLPKETRLLPGHGPETTVGEEITNNPFLKN
jgi:hydroxyacylglutathione hydrolase